MRREIYLGLHSINATLWLVFGALCAVVGKLDSSIRGEDWRYWGGMAIMVGAIAKLSIIVRRFAMVLGEPKLKKNGPLKSPPLDVD